MAIYIRLMEVSALVFALAFAVNLLHAEETWV